MTEVVRAKLRRVDGAKDPNDMARAGILTDLLQAAIAEAVAVGAKQDARFPFIYPADMAAAEADTFLIDDWLPEGGIHLLYAPKDCLKSFVAVDWAMSVAAGHAWKGFPTRQGLAVYIAGEGNRGLRRRFKAWCIRHGVDFESLPLALSLWPMQVLDPQNIAQWAAHIAKVETDFGLPARFIVVDTLATNFGPGDENAPTDMARFLAMLATHLKRAPETTILVVHHSGKDAEKGARGGSSIEGNAEAVFTIQRIAKKGSDWDQTIELRCKHMNLKAAV
jgi:RecA-family ATPase